MPFSAEAKQIWLDRRQIAKKYDSYQWQKLFWVGLGLLPYALTGGGLKAGEMVLTAICLIGGGAGLLIWRKINAAPPAPQLKTANAWLKADRLRRKLAAFRIDRAVLQVGALQALRGVGDRARDAEVVGLVLEHQDIAPRR